MKYKLDNKLKDITIIPENMKDGYYIGKVLEKHKMPHRLTITNGELTDVTFGIMNLWAFLAYDSLKPQENKT